MAESGKSPRQYISAAAPESARAGRLAGTEPFQRIGQADRLGMTGAEFRLYVWNSLPEGHRTEACRQIRMRCEAFISSVRVDRTQRQPETDRLVSEVVAHLLRATSVKREESRPARAQSETEAMPWPAAGLTVDERDSRKDGRVGWMVEETCNRQALSHRYEDMRRRDRGGKWDGSGYPLVSVDDQTMEHLSGHYDPAADEIDALEAQDTRRAWDGLLQLAKHQFGAEDPVVALVQVLAEDPDVQESFGSQWPVGKIVRALNERHSGVQWNDDLVENAKRRLTKFMARFKQQHGLDAVDLRALLARYARERKVVTGRPPRGN